MQENHTPSLEDVQDQLARFCACVYDPADLIEIRRLPSGRSTWHLASELSNLAPQLIADNDNGEHIYIGVNPRVVVGDGCGASECNGDVRCGRCKRCVQLARCLFVDLDKMSLDQARLRLRDSGLPAPTMTVASGGGIHFYWRLDDTLTDLDQWSQLQRGVIAKLDADPKVHDAPRIMRAPGFLNHKYDPPRPCTIIAADPDRTYPLDEFAELETDGAQLESAPPVRADAQLVEGERNNALFRLASGMRAKGFGESAIAAALVVHNREQCKPPLPEDEVSRIAKSAGKYTPGAIAAKAWKPFPVELFPQPIRRFITEGAKAIACDLAFIALPTLAMIAAVVGTTRRIRLKRTWAEPPIAWCVAVGRSGVAMKSPAQDYAIAPLLELQAELFRKYDEAMQEYEREKSRYDADRRARKDKIRDEPLKEPARPEPMRVLIDNATIESLAPILRHNRRGVLMARDELAGWIGGFDAYKSTRGNDVPQWLQLHRAGHVIIDRKTGPTPTIYVPLAAVSVCGTIQPGTLGRVLTREYYECGLAARLLLAAPPTRPKRWTDAEVSTKTTEAASAVLRNLFALQHHCEALSSPKPIDIPLAPDARQAWIEFYDEHAELQYTTEDDDLSSAYSKLEGYAARFALIFHLIRWAADSKHPHDVIQVQSVRDGIALARWFVNETERVYTFMGGGASVVDAKLIELIRENGGEITVRDLQRKVSAFSPSAQLPRAALDAIAKAGKGEWIEVRPGPRGGQPTRVFRLSGDNRDSDNTAGGNP